ncbi:hypothetical protein A3A76_01320 [Candidatus Woesebacteria bacterium RIFCSPLOWO2_01_FULL_39_23]|uniref:Diacylglycerol kinase n=1 Tax=Candidatus Woesebacteria bacterium RIFCSPHIGHO2_01_FULL_40_22 TaxID=1802499 RepID=A0A1F7YIU5_9BACT|nr:MAG: hypothetical protein A2141_05050 [Candidatus Woesebacteria bacterium RBG_16_40_11]OGM26465.1 MAG: hypothetical protein A2628_02915 [Candidatus Woesebacteria bacterium RIFCSPHIGHO2_01_FULL_40_22]OGM37634.1 MAG: hypothetical protein A3E41_05430 [Candidatus Woesebacteria bacterium RIFCSPHIGHO2_12_FULL_38_9]OGM62918.1 MAG: hypothetical protein A3A76_01320 [Candidatus Woesebacteria bacterium RIFCSPLOWO2_01_FULL_39_23]
MGIRHSTIRSFAYAITGLKTAIKSEPNLKIHIVAGTLALLTGLILKLSYLEWLLLLFTIFYVITLELLNTVMEAFVDLVSPEMSPFAKIAKDVSAACVLLAALISVIIGSVLFLPKIILILK